MKEEFVVCKCGKFHALTRHRFGCNECSCGRTIDRALKNLRTVDELACEAEEAYFLKIEASLD